MNLTLMPSKRDRALRGLKALRVLRDFMAPSSEYPSALAIKLTSDTCNTSDKKRERKKMNETCYCRL